MKIYSKVVIDIETSEIISEDSFEYSGPVSEAKGDTDAVDEKYNAGMLKISQEQEAMQNKLFNQYLYGNTAGTDDPNTISQAELEQKNIQDAYSLSDPETANTLSGLKLSTAQNTANLGLVDQAAALQKAQMGEQQSMISGRAPLLSQYYDAAAKGENVNDAMNQAGADVAQQFGAARSSLNRNLALRGEGGASADEMRKFATDQARATALARSTARRSTTETNLNNLRSALTLGDT